MEQSVGYKAQLVAKDYSEKFGTDYDHTYVPAVRHTTIRTFFAAQCKMHVRHADVTTTFLHGNMEEEIYMEQPEDTIQTEQEKNVCKVKNRFTD